MRKVLFDSAISFDHYLARTDGSVDWLLWSDDAAAVMTEYWKRVDTIVMGRKTFEVSLKLGGGAGLPGMKTYVISRTLAEGSHEGVTIINADAAEFVRELKKEDGLDICLMGGGVLAQSLFEARLVDEIGFNVHPVLLGSGIPLFRPLSQQIDLELLACKPFKDGCVYMSYRLKN